jgi:hypothetical protein
MWSGRAPEAIALTASSCWQRGILGSGGSADEWNGHGAVATELGSFAGFIGYRVPVALAIVAVGITATADL